MIAPSVRSAATLRAYPWPVLALIALAYALALHRLDAQSIWFDEGWSAFAATRPTLLATAGADPTNPPLYYLLLSLSTRVLGDSAFALRWFSAVWGMLAIPLAYQLARRLADRRAGLWTAFLVAISPLLAWAGREARMYTLLAVLALVAALAWHRLRVVETTSPGRAGGLRAAPAAWLALLGAELGLLYAHNTGPVAVLWLNAVTVIGWAVDRWRGRRDLHPRPRAWFAGQLAVAALWAPYFFGRYVALAGANRAVAAVSEPDLAFISRVWQAPWTGPWLMVGQEPALVASAFVILGLTLVAGPWRHPGARWLLLHAALLVGGMLIGLWILGNELHGRYLVLLTPLLLAAIGIGVAGVRTPWIRRLACLVFALNAAAAIYLANTQSGYGHEDVRGMVEDYAERLDADASVLAWSYADRYDLAYYWDRLGVEARRVTLPENADLDAIVPLLPTRGDVAINVWFAQRADYRGMLECVLGNGATDEPEVYTVPGMTSLVYRDIRLEPPKRVPLAGRIGEAQVVEVGALPAGSADRAVCLPVTIALTSRLAGDAQAAVIVSDAAGRELRPRRRDLRPGGSADEQRGRPRCAADRVAAPAAPGRHAAGALSGHPARVRRGEPVGLRRDWGGRGACGQGPGRRDLGCRCGSSRTGIKVAASAVPLLQPSAYPLFGAHARDRAGFATVVVGRDAMPMPAISLYRKGLEMSHILGWRRTLVRTALALALPATLALVGWAAGSWVAQAARLGSGLGDGASFIRVQNVAGLPIDWLTPTPTPAATASLHIELRDQTGSGEVLDQAGPMPRSAAFAPPPAVLDRVFGLRSAILRSNQPIAAVTGAIWPASGKFAELTQAVPSTHVVMPIAVRRDSDNAYLAIQNSDQSRPAAVVLTWSRFGQGETGVPSVRRTIPAGQAILLDLETDPELSNTLRGFAGAMHVAADVPVAVHVWVNQKTMQKGMYAYEGIPAEQASDRLFIPFFRNDFYGTTAIAFTNLQPEAVEVTLNYRGSPYSTNEACKDATFVHNGGPVQVKPATSLLFLQANYRTDAGVSGLPSRCMGSAVLEVKGGQGVAVVVDADAPKGTAAAYTAVGREQAANLVAVPAFRLHYGRDEISTGIAMMNVGNTPAFVTIGIYADNGSQVNSPCGADCLSATIAPGDVAFWPGGQSMSSVSFPHDTINAALVSSTQPLAVIVNDASGTGTLDTAMYNGIPIDDAAAEAPADRLIPLVLGGARGIYLPYVARGR